MNFVISILCLLTLLTVASLDNVSAGAFMSRSSDSDKGLLNVTIQTDKSLAPLTLVCISDTHGKHGELTMPPGDVLIHAGDFTFYGDVEHAKDLNTWFGTLPYKHIIVVRGNHECNAPWKKETAQILSNARLLMNEKMEIDGWGFYGTDFYWNCKDRNPYYDDWIPDSADIVIAHNPAKGHVDMNKGCPALNAKINELQPTVLISGHVHGGRGIQKSGKTVYVNAAVVDHERDLTKQPIVLQLLPKQN